MSISVSEPKALPGGSFPEGKEGMAWKGKGQVSSSQRGLDLHMEENIPILSSFGCGIMLLEGQGDKFCSCMGKMGCRTLKGLDQTHVPERVGVEGGSTCCWSGNLVVPHQLSGNGKDMTFTESSLHELAMPVDF